MVSLPPDQDASCRAQHPAEVRAIRPLCASYPPSTTSRSSSPPPPPLNPTPASPPPPRPPCTIVPRHPATRS
eukprot:8480-Chlamydomonas_euryale.AAC.1